MTTEAGEKPVQIPRTLTVRELADLLGVTGVQIVKTLIASSVMADVTKAIDYDTAAMIATQFGFQPTQGGEVLEDPAASATIDLFADETPDDAASLRPRHPVVALLGHVDHGKTSLLDLVRDTRVTAGEAGGITQHIGAYQAMCNDQLITFLDTPGHEAFTQMRARGVGATDIAVLVVAADDGVMPQTIEAIDHIRAAGVPMIVALNKIDLPNANPDRVKSQLTEREVVIEEYGGDVPLVPVSAVTREGLDNLLETILLVAELQDLKGNPDRIADGVVLEAELDRRQGSRTTVLVQRGTLRPGATLLVGETWGKVKALLDFRGRRITAAGPSTPVSILGIQDIAEAGDRFRVMKNEREAKAIYESAKRVRETAAAKVGHAASLDALFGEISRGTTRELNLILKTDVQGSVDPIRTALEQLSGDEVRVKVIHGAVGAVTESDVNLALAAKGIVLTFNTEAAPGAAKLAAAEGIEIRRYDVIYKVVEEVDAALSGLLEPIVVDVVDAQAEVLQIFAIRRLGNVAGSRAIEGTVRRDALVRVLRGDQRLAEGKIASLRRFQNDAREVQAGQEFGVAVEGFQDIEPGDRLEFFHQEQQSRAITRGRTPPATANRT